MAGTGLPRDVLKWLLSLDLTYPVKNPKRDFSNGFTVAEIFSRYYPQDVQMHSFDTGISMKNKLANWELLEKFFTRNGIPVSNALINDLIHNNPGAGTQLIEIIYPFLTKKTIDKIAPPPQEPVAAPSFLKPTASKLIKESVSELELQYKKNSTEYFTKQAEDIIAKQKQEIKAERADATSERLLSTTAGLDKGSKVQRLSTQRPLNEQPSVEQVEFKEIQVRAVDLDMSRIRQSNPSNSPNKVRIAL